MSFQGKCKFQFEMKEKLAVAFNEGVRGVVGIILFDETNKNERIELYNALQVNKDDWDDKNFKILKALAFKGNPFKVIVYNGKNIATTSLLATALKDEPNYLCAPYDGTEEQTLFTDLESWINSKRNKETIKLGNDTSTIKLVTSSQAGPDQPWIIDYDARQTQHVVAGFDDVVFGAQEYTVCIASLCAGAPLNSSITNKVMPWLKAFTTTIEDEDKAIKEGKLVTGFDGEKYSILRGVTSFVTPTDDKNKTFSKIRLMEIMDLNQKDIRDVFNSSYRGHYQNGYSNRMLLFGAVNAYLKGFMVRGQLNPNYENKMEHDIEAIRNYIRGQGKYKGKPVTEDLLMKLTPYELMRADTGDEVFATVPEYRPVDVMENFTGTAIIA